MLVRQLIGRQAGQVIDLPWHAATACLSSGTVQALTPAEQDAHRAREDALARGETPPDASVEPAPAPKPEPEPEPEPAAKSAKRK